MDHVKHIRPIKNDFFPLKHRQTFYYLDIVCVIINVFLYCILFLCTLYDRTTNVTSSIPCFLSKFLRTLLVVNLTC